MKTKLVPVFILILSSQVLSAVINVPGDYATIQEAIDAAVSGDTVLVASGTYVENIDFKGKSIAVKSSDGPEVTIIDGNQAGSVVTFPGGGGEINGFTITNGTNIGGSGIRCESSSPTIIHNIITKNINVTSDFVALGGGIFCEQANARIICNIISHNRLDSPNAIQQRGGGIYCGLSNNVYIANNLITDNFALNRGGGISFSGSIVGKDHCTMENNTLAGNEAEMGGGIYCSEGNCRISCVNEVLWDNQAALGPEICLSGGPAQVILTIRYSDVRGGQSSVYVGPQSSLDWGPGMIDQDPLFFDPGQEDYHLQQDPCQPGIINPCVDSGNTLVCNWGYDLCSTKTNQDPDDEVMDMGFHYGPLSDLSLRCDPYQISESGGGSVQLILTAGGEYQKRDYLILGGMSGTMPGFTLPGGLVTLPVNWDAFTSAVLLLLNTPVFTDFLGKLGDEGEGSALIESATLPPGSAGLVLHFAYLLAYPFDFVSNPVEIRIGP